MISNARTRPALFALGLIGTLALLVALWLPAEAAPKRCSQEDAIKAETEASTLHSWRHVFNSYEKYRRCDDGAISEGYSNSIALLLANNWEQLGELTEIYITHPGFQEFVLHHVDELMSQDQAKLIENNAMGKCPRASIQFCVALVKQLAKYSPS
jgi:hypothetical protein